MRKPPSRAAIPVIEILKSGKYFEVHWDYQEGPESAILTKRAEYLRGYIDGAMDMLQIRPDCVCCASGLTGTVKRLDERQAEMLHGALTQLLVPMVQAEHARLQAFAALPHVRLAIGNL